MNVRQMVEKYLKENGFDGLFADVPGGCGCEIGDLMPCEEPCDVCEAGVKIVCIDPDCDYGSEPHWHIMVQKESEVKDGKDGI